MQQPHAPQCPEFATRSLIALMSLRVLPIILIVQTQTAFPRFGHAQIVLPAQRFWEAGSGRPAMSATEALAGARRAYARQAGRQAEIAG
jgi:ATP-dependent protease HslVU (ClpYQ) peptidase subunit